MLPAHAYSRPGKHSAKVLLGCLDSAWAFWSAFFFVTLKELMQIVHFTSSLAVACLRSTESSVTMPALEFEFCSRFFSALPPRGIAPATGSEGNSEGHPGARRSK